MSRAQVKSIRYIKTGKNIEKYELIIKQHLDELLQVCVLNTVPIRDETVKYFFFTCNPVPGQPHAPAAPCVIRHR